MEVVEASRESLLVFLESLGFHFNLHAKNNKMLWNYSTRDRVLLVVLIVALLIFGFLELNREDGWLAGGRKQKEN